MDYRLIFLVQMGQIRVAYRKFLRGLEGEGGNGPGSPP